jgi:dynein heavy chain, axonemal
LGDILLAVGSLSYLGAFTGEFRKRITFKKWIPIVNSQEIICNQEFSFINRIGDPIKIQDWVM